MAPKTEFPTRADVPPQLLTAVEEGAAADADLVIRFFGLLGLTPRPGETTYWPRSFLLDLGAALRLYVWETAGLTAHRDAGLPPARDAVRKVCLAAAGPGDTPAPPLYRQVVRLAVERLAWTGGRDLRAHIELGDPDEDVLVEALARVPWANRHTVPTPPRRIDP